MTNPASLSLRERKRAETRAQLERAAVDLVLAEGLNGATVEAISERAFVSSRTFFNYFDSKEDAVLGIRDTELDDELAELLAERPDHDLVANLIRLLIRLFAPSAEHGTLHGARKEAMKRYPQLLTRHMHQMSRMSAGLTAVATQLMEQDPAFAGVCEQDAQRYAETILGICGSATRTILHEWAVGGGTGNINDLESAARQLVREVTERLA